MVAHGRKPLEDMIDLFELSVDLVVTDGNDIGGMDQHDRDLKECDDEMSLVALGRKGSLVLKTYLQVLM